MIDWTVTDLQGYPVGDVSSLGQHSDGVVKIALNDDRSATVRVSLYDPICTALRPLEVLLKARYNGLRVFGGVLQVPGFQGEEGVVELSAQGPSRRLDAAPLIDPTVTYSSVDQLIEAARPARYGYPNAPDHGVKRWPGVATWERRAIDVGYGGTGWTLVPPGRGPFPHMDISNGASAWQVITDATKSAFGPDINLRPIEHVAGTWDYVEMDVATRIGRELQDDPSVVFHYRWGRNNCVDAGYAPGGDKVVNAYFSELSSGSGDEAVTTVLGYYSPPEIERMGLYAGYEGSGGCSGAGGGPIAQVAAYRDVPRFFTFQPAIEGPGGGFGYRHDAEGRLEKIDGLGVPPRFGIDYDVGDTVKVVARRGWFLQELVGRLTDAELREVDAAGNVQVSLTAAPRVNFEGLDSDMQEFAR